MHSRKSVSILCIISIAYWLAYQGYEANFFKQIKPVYKHGINFSLLISVAIVGYYYFSTNAQKWAAALWLVVYCSTIILIGLMGFIDLFRRFDSQNFRDLFGYLRLFFTSPVPFSVLLFLSRNPIKPR